MHGWNIVTNSAFIILAKEALFIFDFLFFEPEGLTSGFFGSPQSFFKKLLFTLLDLERVDPSNWWLLISTLRSMQVLGGLLDWILFLDLAQVQLAAILHHLALVHHFLELLLINMSWLSHLVP